MILVATYKEKKNGKTQVFVSHLVDTDTLEDIPCQQIPVSEMPGIRFDANLGSYRLIDDEQAVREPGL